MLASWWLTTARLSSAWLNRSSRLPEDVGPLLLHLPQAGVAVLGPELGLEEGQLAADGLTVGDAEVPPVVVQRGEETQEGGEERRDCGLARGGQHPPPGSFR